MNSYCDVLDIEVPSLQEVKGHREAIPYSLLIVALLEEGGPLTLQEVADQFEHAGIGTKAEALRSLQRCRPARAPVYRDGDHYALDPHDDQLSLWVFRLGLRPPRVPRLHLVRPEPEPLPGPDTPLSPREVEEAFRDQYLGTPWSAQRLALAILDAHGSPMPGLEVIHTLSGLTHHHHLREGSAQYWRAGAIAVSAKGVWTLEPDHKALLSARGAVRERIEVIRRRRAQGPDPAVQAALLKRYEAERAARAAELAQLRHVLVHAFPTKAPEAVTLVDVAERQVVTFIGNAVAEVPARLAGYGLIGAVGVRPLLRALGFEHEARRLAELSPPQKTVRLNRRGRTLKITVEMLVRASCGISNPFGNARTLQRYLDEGRTSRLRLRLEADAKSLFHFYQYARLHRGVRLRWGFLDEMLPAPWVYREEQTLHGLKQEAFERGIPLEVVVFSAPGWADPWSRGRKWTVERDRSGYGYDLFDEDGIEVSYWDEWEIQAARVWAG